MRCAATQRGAKHPVSDDSRRRRPRPRSYARAIGDSDRATDLVIRPSPWPSFQVVTSSRFQPTGRRCRCSGQSLPSRCCQNSSRACSSCSGVAASFTHASVQRQAGVSADIRPPQLGLCKQQVGVGRKASWRVARHRLHSRTDVHPCSVRCCLNPFTSLSLTSNRIGDTSGISCIAPVHSGVQCPAVHRRQPTAATLLVGMPTDSTETSDRPAGSFSDESRRLTEHA